jgi:hypothetical protein
MYETELSEIERHVAADEPKKALAIARGIFKAHDEHPFDAGYRQAWEKANELTTVPVTIGDQVERATVVNDLSTAEDFGDKIWLLQIGCGISTFFYAISARTEQDAMDEYADNEHVNHLTLLDEDDDTYHEDDCISLGNAGERHYFEGYHLSVIQRPAPEAPFKMEADLRNQPAPVR